MRFSFRVKLFCVLAIVLGTLILFKPPIDPDFGWHYQYGRYFLQTGSLLRENTFSYTLPAYVWVNSYWLAQLILVLLFDYTSAVGMSLVLSLVVSCVVVSALLKSKAVVGKKELFAFFTTAVLVFLTFSLSALSVRPLAFSTVFLITVAFILLNCQKRNHFLVLPILFLVWANVHADFTLGLFVYGLYVAGLGIKSIRAKRRDLDLLFHCCVFAASACATLVTPWGISLYTTIITEILSSGTSANIVEFAPFNSPHWETLTLTALVLALSVVGVLNYKKDLPLWYIVALLFFLVLALKSVYFVRVQVALGMFLIFWFLSDFTADIKSLLGEHKQKKVAYILYGFLFLLTGVVFVSFVNFAAMANEQKAWAQKKGYPYGAVMYLEQNSLPGNMFNSYGWGGYLINVFQGSKKTFIDGRMPSWKQDGWIPFADYMKIQYFPEENYELFEQLRKQYDIAYVLDKSDSKLVQYLLEQHADRWEVAYSDDTATILVYIRP